VPIIYKINSLSEVNEISVINININIDYSEDFRIKYIKKMKVNYLHMIDLICSSNRTINYYWYANLMLQNEKKYYARVFSKETGFINVIKYIILTVIKLPILFFRRFVQTIVRNYYQKKIDTLNIPSIIKKNI